MSNDQITLETDDERTLWMATRAEASRASDPAARADEAVRDLRKRTGRVTEADSALDTTEAIAALCHPIIHKIQRARPDLEVRFTVSPAGRDDGEVPVPEVEPTDHPVKEDLHDWRIQATTGVLAAAGGNRMSGLVGMARQVAGKLARLQAERDEHLVIIAAVRQAVTEIRGDCSAGVEVASDIEAIGRGLLLNSETAGFLSDLVGDAIVRSSLGVGERAVDVGKRHAGHALLSCVDRLRERAETAEAEAKRLESLRDCAVSGHQETMRQLQEMRGRAEAAEAELASVADVLGITDHEDADLSHELSLYIAGLHGGQKSLGSERDRLAEGLAAMRSHVETIARAHAEVMSGHHCDEMIDTYNRVIERAILAALSDGQPEPSMAYHQAWSEAKDRPDYDRAAWSRKQFAGEQMGRNRLRWWLDFVYGTAALADPADQPAEDGEPPVA